MKRGLQLLVFASAVLAVNRLIQQAKPEMDLNGQVALISGGTRGIGFLLAQELARQGCKVIVCGRDQKSVELAKSALLNYTPGVMAVQCDASDRAQISRLVEKVIRRFGQIDILINAVTRDIEQATISSANSTSAVLTHMRRRDCGRIVDLVSTITPGAQFKDEQEIVRHILYELKRCDTRRATLNLSETKPAGRIDRSLLARFKQEREKVIS